MKGEPLALRMDVAPRLEWARVSLPEEKGKDEGGREEGSFMEKVCMRTHTQCLNYKFIM